MNRTTMVIGVLLVAGGLCGMLDAAGIADWSQTAGSWWPLAIVAWAVIDISADRRITLAGLVWVGLGIALLSGEQAWTTAALTWSAFAAFAGLAALTTALAAVPASRRDAGAVAATRRELP